MKLHSTPMKVFFPLKSYLGQLVCSGMETVYQPCRFWRAYRIAHLERCWNWKKERAEKLERCWQQKWRPKPPAQLRCDRVQPPTITLKWRGVAYDRRAVNVAGVTQPAASSVNDLEGLMRDSRCQHSPHLSQTLPST